MSTHLWITSVRPVGDYAGQETPAGPESRPWRTGWPVMPEASSGHMVVENYAKNTIL